jgi:hypothetical protein
VTRPSLRWALRFGLLGGVVAVLLFFILNYTASQRPLDTYFFIHRVIRVLWPSAFWLLATAGAEETLQARMIVGLSIGANAILYALVGALLSVFRPRHARVRASTSR